MLSGNYLDFSTMLNCNLVGNGQTKATAGFLSRPHQFKQMFNRRRLDTDTIIAKKQLRAARDSIEPGRNLELATLWHRIDAVVRQIKKELHETIAITPN